jgi:tellurite resistance protein
MNNENYNTLESTITEKSDDLKDYIYTYLKIELNKRPVKDFLSFNLIDDKENIIKTIDFSGDKSVYFKVLWNILRGKKEYNSHPIEMRVTEPVVKYTAESLVEYYRNDVNIMNLSIAFLRKERFNTLIKSTAQKHNLNPDDKQVKDLFKVFDPSESEIEPSSLGNTVNMLEIAMSSQVIKDYFYNTLRETELAQDIKWELRKYLYTALGVTVSGAWLFAFLPIIVAGVLVGAVAFKNGIVRLISSGISKKMTANIRILTQAIFGSIKFQEVLADEIIRIVVEGEPKSIAGIEKVSNENEDTILDKEDLTESEAKKIKALTHPEELKVSNIFAYLKVLAAMMWADGVLKPEEVELWKKITSMDLGLSEKQSLELEEWFKEGPNLNIIGSEITDDREKNFVVRQAMIMSMIDGEVDPKEIELVRYLADEFDLSKDDLNDIEREAKKLLEFE